MLESSIVVVADGENQNFYRLLKKLEGDLKIFSSFQAAKKINEIDADIVLIDCGYKNSMGLSILKDVKSLHPKTPVIFLTDASSEDLAIAAFRSGAREYFKKPINFSLLLDTIRGLMELKRNSKEKRKPFSKSPEYSLELANAMKKDNIPPRLLCVFIYMNEHLEEKMSLSSLADHANMSKYHFSRMYRKYFGASPMKQMNILRINRAKQLLAKRNLRITEISFFVGYDDLNRFIRNFKNLTGQTPSEFRKKHK